MDHIPRRGFALKRKYVYDRVDTIVTERLFTVQEKGLYIALDGIDGCGKSTQCMKLAEHFGSLGRTVLLTREPGGTEIGAELRSRLLSSKYDLEPESEMMLFFVDRLEHLTKKVIPALNEGMVVISDRFTASTYAYQVYGRGIDESIYSNLADLALKRVPDIALIIDSEPITCVARARERLSQTGTEEAEGKFEQLPYEFFVNVRNGFMKFAEQNPYTKIIDGMGSVDDIFARILSNIK
jgi:dTMP kinase